MSVDCPVNSRAATSGGKWGLGGSPSRRGTAANPMAPAATDTPRSSTTSKVAVTERRPRRTRVLVAVTRAGAGTGRIRRDRSVVSVQTSGSSSTEIPATASTG